MFIMLYQIVWKYITNCLYLHRFGKTTTNKTLASCIQFVIIQHHLLFLRGAKVVIIGG